MLPKDLGIGWSTSAPTMSHHAYPNKYATPCLALLLHHTMPNLITTSQHA